MVMDTAFNESGKWNSFLTNIRRTNFVWIYRDETPFVRHVNDDNLSESHIPQHKHDEYGEARVAHVVFDYYIIHQQISITPIFTFTKSNKYKLLWPDTVRWLSSGIDFWFSSIRRSSNYNLMCAKSRVFLTLSVTRYVPQCRRCHWISFIHLRFFFFHFQDSDEAHFSVPI